MMIISTLFLTSKICANHLCRRTTPENKQIKKENMNIYILSDKAFKGTIVNQALPSLHGGSLEILLTVPLRMI